MNSVFLCILLNENYCLNAKFTETKFIYHVMCACIEFKLKISDRKKSFPCFFDNPNWSVRPRWLRPPQTMESTEKGFKTSLILISSVTRVSVKFLLWKKKNKASYDDQLLILFFLKNFHVYAEWKDMRVIDISASERQNCLLHLLLLEFRVL